jgi:hypothetical protein
MNSQMTFQDEINLHNQEKKAINASWNELNRDNFNYKLDTTYTTRFLIVYFVPLHGYYIQMLLFPEIPKWESQN